MADKQSIFVNTNRKIFRLSFGASLLGALLTFIYLTLIDPAPRGDAALAEPDFDDIFTFAIAVLVLFSANWALSRRSFRPIAIWYEKLQSGVPASELPISVARRVLNGPFISSAFAGSSWLAAAVFFAILFSRPANFYGMAIGGIVTTSIIFFGSELLWRRVIPIFIPDGNLSAVPAIRLPVQRRLLLAFTLIGVLPLLLLVILTQARIGALLDAPNPEAVLDNLLLMQRFILISGLLASVTMAVLVARAIVGPLQMLEGTMGRVEKNDFSVRAMVMTKDEIGYLSERFNQMTVGLRQGEKLRKLFGLYVSPEVAQAAVETGAGLGGELVNCTVMFSDIRDFTPLTEQMAPSVLVDLINRYMTAMVSIISEHGGVVTRFGGDSILAVFGTPLNPMSDHAERAVETALEMRQALAAFNQTTTAAKGSPLENGIGIATGPVVAGNVGGKERIEYTVMGDAANLASRLEGKTKEVGFPILISDETYQILDEVPDIGARPLNDVQIKGKQDRVTIYALSA